MKKFVEEHADEYEISPGWEAGLNKHYSIDKVDCKQKHINSIYPMVENSLADRSFFHRYTTPSTNKESSSTEKEAVFNIM